MEKSTIMIVDDQPENIKLLISYLQDADFRIAVAQSGEEALQRMQWVKPDIMLLDVKMSGLDGFDTCRRLKQQENTRGIPVIFVTIASESVDKVKGFEAGGVDYISKPFQYEEVLARINAHLNNYRLQRQLQEEKARFQALSKATFEGIIIHDEGVILEVNDTAAKMFGYTRSELIGQNVLNLVIPALRETVLQYIHSRYELPYEVEGLRNDGGIIPIEVQAKPLPWQEREVRVAAIRDLTWRKQIEAEHNHLRKENIALKTSILDRYKFGKIIGKSRAMQEVYESIANASASEANVVVCGESGTGKELVAQTIHQQSERKHRNFIAVNCGAVPETLFEREFFGHRKGAFTGAAMDKPGYFDHAHKGTLFLDEVSELSPALQVKLLRVLQENEYIPLGDTVSKKVDVRIIAATNKNLKELLHQGVIRKDFYYRIHVIVINLPPLRDRQEDIPLLIEHFLQHYATKKPHPTLPPKILKLLRAHQWPGNVRELQNELQRYLAEQRLEFADQTDALVIGNEVMHTSSEQGEFSLYKAVDDFERRFVLDVFKQKYRNRKHTAAALGIDRKTLYTKLKKYGVI